MKGNQVMRSGIICTKMPFPHSKPSYFMTKVKILKVIAIFKNARMCQYAKSLQASQDCNRSFLRSQ